MKTLSEFRNQTARENRVRSWSGTTRISFTFIFLFLLSLLTFETQAFDQKEHISGFDYARLSGSDPLTPGIPTSTYQGHDAARSENNPLVAQFQSSAELTVKKSDPERNVAAQTSDRISYKMSGTTMILTFPDDRVLEYSESLSPESAEWKIAAQGTGSYQVDLNSNSTASTGFFRLSPRK